MKEVPFDRKVIHAMIQEMGLDMALGSIREMNQLVNDVVKRFDTEFIRMEFGVPGLKAGRIAAEAEAKMLIEDEVANTYPPFQGTPELKSAGSEFCKAFMDMDIPPECVIPTVGSMQGCFIALGLAGFHNPEKSTILFLDPGFPVNKKQVDFYGLNSISLELKDCRGDDLKNEVDRLCREHPIAGCMWSSPNNPAWIILSEDELEGLAEVFDKHGVFAIEDMAYFGMDFRQDYSKPYEPPYQPTIARYMERVFITLSSSKLFSYAGQRCGLALIPPKFASQKFPALQSRFTKPDILGAFVHGGIYPTTSGVPQGPQRGLATLLKATVDGSYSPWESVRTYQHRAAFMKKTFLENGFSLVYDRDRDKPLADGFYFTISYPGMNSGQLAEEMIYYGISAITLDVTGSTQQGLRACVSLFREDQFEILAYRLKRFHEDHQ